MKKIFTTTAVLSIFFSVFFTVSARSEIVLKDTFENVPDNSGINVDYDIAGRQTGTIAPTNYVTGGNNPGTYTNLIVSGEVSQLGPGWGGYFSPNANFTDLEENFVVECDALIGSGATWLDAVVGSSSRNKASWADGHGVTFQKSGNMIFFYENYVTLAAHPVNINMASNMHIAFVVANKSYGGSDKPRISLFVNDKALPIYTVTNPTARYEYYTREGSNPYTDNFLTFLSFNETNPSFFDNVNVKNIAKAISTRRWLTDSDLELDSSKTYSHAVNFNAGANVTVDGVTFNNTTNGQIFGANWTMINDVGNVWLYQNNSNSQITGDGAGLATNYIETTWRTASSLELTGLNPGDVNLLKLYGVVKFDDTIDNHRKNYLATSVGGQYEIDQNEFDEGTGIIFNIIYTVPKSGNITVAITPEATERKNQYCWFAFSNMEASPPFVAGNVSASQGTYSNKVVVTWDFAAGAEIFKVYRNDTNDSSGAATVSADLTSNSFEETVTPNVYYYYWIKSGNTNGWSEFSDTALGFATDSTAPAKPANVSPADGEILTSFPVTLEGDAFSGANPMKSSQWQIDNKPDFSFIDYDSGEIISTNTTFEAPSSPLGTQTYWRARYRDTLNLWSDWSEPTSFGVQRNTNLPCLFLDTFNNVSGSGNVNKDYTVSGRQSGTIAPCEYYIEGTTEVGSSGKLTLTGENSSCTPGYNFEEDKEFKLEFDFEPSASGTGISVCKINKNASPFSNGGMGFVFYSGGNGVYKVRRNSVEFTLTNDLVKSTSFHFMLAVSQTDEAGDLFSIFIDGEPLPLGRFIFVDPVTNLYDHKNYFYMFRPGEDLFDDNFISLYNFGGVATIDNFKVTPVTTKYSARTWETDEDLWIGTSNEVAAFSHAVNLNWTNQPPTINIEGLDFDCPGLLHVLQTNDSISNVTGTDWSVIGAGGWIAGNMSTYKSAPLPSGNGVDIAEYSIYGWGSSIGIILSNLTPNSSNIFNIYGRPFDIDRERNAYISGSDGGFCLVNENEVTTKCQIIEYEYIAGNDGTFTLTFTSGTGQDYMLHGFSSIETGVPEIGIVIGNLLSVIGIFFALRKKYSRNL